MCNIMYINGSEQTHCHVLPLANNFQYIDRTYTQVCQVCRQLNETEISHVVTS